MSQVNFTRAQLEAAIRYVLGDKVFSSLDRVATGVLLPYPAELAALKAFREDWPTENQLDLIREYLLVLSNNGWVEFRDGTTEKIPDLMETLESAAEARLYEITDGLPIGQFRCRCGQISDLASALPASDNPYADPICSQCATPEGGENE